MTEYSETKYSFEKTNVNIYVTACESPNCELDYFLSKMAIPDADKKRYKDGVKSGNLKLFNVGIKILLASENWILSEAWLGNRLGDFYDIKLKDALTLIDIATKQINIESINHLKPRLKKNVLEDIDSIKNEIQIRLKGATQ